jgi:hypothetical protein
VCGHFHGDRFAAHQNAFRFTFLREPVDNLISIFYFWRTFPPSGYPAHERFLAEHPSIFEFAQYPEMRLLASVGYFSGIGIGELDFVGFYERRTQDLATLARLLGIKLESGIYLNRTDRRFDSERSELKADAAAIARLGCLLADDVEFYRQALDHWSQRRLDRTGDHRLSRHDPTEGSG